MNNIIVTEAHKFIGTKYIHQGRNVHGVDCIGLVSLICDNLKLGNTKYDRGDYPPTGNGINIHSRLKKCGFIIKDCDVPEPGDLITFFIGKSTRIQHLGIMCFKNTFIHTHQGVGYVTKHTFCGSWKKRVKSIWSFPENPELS